MINLLTALYGLAGILTFVGYFPTIKDLWQKKPSANLSTYGLWIATMLITFLYALFVNGDILFVIVVGLQLLACVIIFFLRFRLP